MNRIILVCTVAIAFLFIGCDHGGEGRVLKVGISPWPGYEPLMLAAEKSFFAKLKVRLVRFSTPTESYRALRDGVIDVAAFTADEVFHFAEVRDKPRIFLVLDVSYGADAIIARPEIKNIDALKGKKLGVEGSALGEYLIHRSFDFAKKLKLTDLTVVHVPIDRQVVAYLNGNIDAAVTYEPFKSQLIARGAHVLFDSRQIPNEIVDVLVANDKTVVERSFDLETLAKGWFLALDYIKAHRQESMALMAKNGELSEKAFQMAFKTLRIPSRTDNLKMLGKEGSLKIPMQALARLMFKQGGLVKEIDVSPLLDDRIVKAIRY